MIRSLETECPCCSKTWHLCRTPQPQSLRRRLDVKQTTDKRVSAPAGAQMLVLAVVLVLAAVPPVDAQTAISADGLVESTTGGFRFPDGTVQLTAMPPGSAPVEATGQLGCWNGSGTGISCSGTGQDGELQRGVNLPTPRFTDGCRRLALAEHQRVVEPCGLRRKAPEFALGTSLHERRAGHLLVVYYYSWRHDACVAREPRRWRGRLLRHQDQRQRCLAGSWRTMIGVSR